MRRPRAGSLVPGVEGMPERSGTEFLVCASERRVALLSKSSDPLQAREMGDEGFGERRDRWALPTGHAHGAPQSRTSLRGAPQPNGGSREGLGLTTSER